MGWAARRGRKTGRQAVGPENLALGSPRGVLIGVAPPESPGDHRGHEHLLAGRLHWVCPDAGLIPTKPSSTRNAILLRSPLLPYRL